MGLIQLLTTTWTVWKVATKRLGPVGGLAVTVVVIGGLAYLRPWLAENVPAVERIIGDMRGQSVSLNRGP